MQNFKAFLSSIPRWKLFLILGGFLTLCAFIIFITPILRHQTSTKIGSAAGLSVTADKQDSLGIFSDSRFTLKSDQDLTAQAIKDNLTIEPETKIEIVEVSPRLYQIVPAEPLAPNEVIKIKLSTGDRDYSWAFQTKNNFRIVQTLPADRTTSVPTNSGIEITFSHDNFENIDNYFSISPKVSGRFERHGRTVSFVPQKLDPATLYTVTVKKGIKLSGSEDTLSDQTVFQFETAGDSVYNQNKFNLVRPAYEFSTKETPAIDLYANNIDSLTTIHVSVFKYPTLEKFTEDYQNKLAIPRWSVNYYDRFTLSSTGLTKSLDFQAPIQKANYSGYFLFPQTLPKGYYLVETDNGGQKSQALVQITDLSAYFTVSGSQTLAWVNRVDTNTPAQSAKVTVLGQDYVTSKDGVAIFNSPTGLVNNANQLVTIKDSQDSLLIPAADRNSYYPYGDYISQRRVSDKYWSYLYLDRPIYQPSDTVKFWGLLRDRDDLNKTQDLTITLTRTDYQDYDYNPVIIFQKDYKTTSIGTFIGEVPLPRLNPGYYNLNIKVGNNNVITSGLTVATYTKPAYQISLDPVKNAVIAGDPIVLNGKAAFFEGTPVSNVNLKISGQSDYSVTSDTQGLFKLSVNTVSNSSGEYQQPIYQNFSVNPVGPEEGDINAGASVAVFNSSYYLRAKNKNQSNQALVTINLNQVDLNKFEPYQYGDDASFIGAPVANHPVQGELVEYTWQKKEVGTYYDFINKTTSPKYEYTQISNSLGQFTLNTDSLGQATYQFPTLNDKYYQLKLSSLDSQNRVSNTTLYIYGNNLYSSAADTRLLLNESKTDNPGNYLIEEPVSLTPTLGSAPVTAGKMLYLFAQRGIKGYSLTDTNKFTFNFKDIFVPDVYVQAVRFTGTTYQLSETKLLRFDNSTKKISLDLKLDKLFYLPGDKAHLTVTAKDQKGNPLSSEVNINLVDEAIFDISPVTTDPLSQIYRTIDSDIVSYYLSHQYPIESNAAEGGGCFLSGTGVLMANGRTQNIEKVRVGDLIKTRTSETNPLMVISRVNQIFTHTVGEYLLINHHLRVTPEHNLYINGRWLLASAAKVGDSYLGEGDHYQLITSIETYTGSYTVYNLSIDKYHTYFADGFYVHNDKGRDLFLDTAFFGTVQTGVNGQAGLDITLPDNLTSWRITGQSLTGDLKAGVKTEKLIVKQPFFVDLVLGQDYLLADKPVLTLRGFGDQLKSGDSVNFHISIPTLNFEKDLSTNSFESVGVALPSLSIGEHQVTVSAQSGSLKDKVTRSFKVVESRLQFSKSDFQALATDSKLTGSATGPTLLTFTDQNAGRFLATLNNLSYSSGDRLDQKITRITAQKLISKYFDQSQNQENFDPSVYRMDDGGYALLPYGSSDLKTSVEIACLANDSIDKAGLVNYLFKQFTNAKETLSASQSLAGLACLKEPVLLLVNKFYTVPDLTDESKIYLGLAQAALGDTEKSGATVKALIKDFGQSQDGSTYVKIGKTKDDYLTNTSLLAAVSAIDNLQEADQLFSYAVTNNTQDVLIGDNLLLYISQRISNLPKTQVSFSYTLDGKKITKDLKSGESFKLLVSKEQLISINFEDIKGNVGVTSTYDITKIPSTGSKDLSLNRNYFVSGKSTSEFVSTDLIKVTLNFSLSPAAQDGCYQLNDYLPSGLKPVTRLFDRNLETKDITYPYAIDGQKVSFCVYKTNQKPINYYARVISPGVFKAESALMQSAVTPSVFTLSNGAQVTIK